jgi:NTE family protein
MGMGRIRKVEDEQVRVTSVFPSEDLGRILIFDNNLIRENLKMGYCDAMRTIKGLKGRKYYIQSFEDENIFFKSLMSVPDKAISDIGVLMGLPQMEPKKMLFEKILPNLSQMLGLPNTSSYQDIMIGVMEKMAQTREIEKYTVRNLTEFLWEIKKARHQKNIPDDSLAQSDKATVKTSAKRLKGRVVEKAGEEFLKILTL